MRALVLLAACILALGGCGTVASNSKSADSDCMGPGMKLAQAYGPDASLKATFAATARQIVAWQERPDAVDGTRILNSDWRQRAPGDAVSVCYYDGNFSNFGKRPAGDAPVELTRALILVTGGEASLLVIGPQAKLRIEDPTRP